MQNQSNQNLEQVKFILATLNLEQKILNFKNLDLSKNQEIRDCQKYFRSSLNKRLIGNQIIYNSIQNKWTSQSSIRNKFKLNKSLVSTIFNECLIAEWIYLKGKSNQPLYKSSRILINSINIYQKYIWKDFNEKDLINFLVSFIQFKT